jgi:hypothetical protein
VNVNSLLDMSNSDPQLVQHLETVWRHGPTAERENLIYGITRYVSKLGDGLWVSDTELRALRTFFRVEDAVELYIRIRDESLRFEDEWRDQFIMYFPDARDALPPQIMIEEEYDKWFDEQIVPISDETTPENL